MSWLLDTCVICEPGRKRPSAPVLAWLDGQPEEMLFLSVLTFGEIRKGIARLPAGARRRRLARWLDHDLRERFSGRILPVDLATADLWGSIQAAAETRGRPMPMLDGLLAATAIAHRMTLVTRNAGDFEGSGVELIDPWN